jgi:O-antigen ligase
MFKERPTLGAGPDNFRHLHGRYLGLAIWNSNIFANNLFLELLADLGAPGLLAFGWLILAVLRRLYRTLFSPSGGPVVLWAAGLGGSLLAFLIHGLLDYFLGISGMYLLFWMTLGLIVAAGRLSGKDAGYGLRLTR